MQTHIQLNENQQKHTYYQNKIYEIMGYAKPEQAAHHLRDERFLSAYYCPHCGAELYMQWDDVHISVDDNTFNHWQYGQDKERKTKQLEILRTENRADYSAATKEAKEFAARNTCFVCCGSLRHEPGYFIQAYDSASYFFGHDNPLFRCCVSAHANYARTGKQFNFQMNIDSILSYMRSIRIPLDEQLAESKTAVFAQQADIPSAKYMPANIANSIKSDLAKLQEHLQLLVRMESNIYALTKHLGNLYLHKEDADRLMLFQSTYPAIKIRTRIEKEIAYTKTKLAHLGASLRELKDTPLPKVQINWPVPPKQPVLETPGLFNKKKVAERNAAKTAQYESELANYQIAYEECKKREAQIIAEHNDQRNRNIQAKQNELDKLTAKYYQLQAQGEDQIATAKAEDVPALAVQNMLQKEIDEAETLLKQFFETRNALYGYNVVFPKYRNIVALSTFCEYLVTGRCSALDGANGAYNLYESECRADMIISQLNVVIESLEQIKQNQYMIYSELQNIRSELASLNNTMEAAISSIRNIEANTASMNQKMDKITESVEVTAHNSVVTAYYSKLNAELTNALGYMVAFS